MNANITKIFLNGFHRVMFNRMAPRITCIASFEHLHSYIHRSSQESVQRLRFVVYVTDVYPYPPRSVHWRGTILQVSSSANQSWVIGVNFVFTNPHRTDNITTTKQSTKNHGHILWDIYVWHSLRRHFQTRIIVFWFKFHRKLISRDPINYMPALSLIMAWHRTGDKPSSEPMMA